MPRPFSTRTCSFPGCETRHYCKGYCIKHYRRWCAHGDPSVSLTEPVPAKMRFMASFKVVGECWIWTGTINHQGYGVIAVGSKTDRSKRNVLAHRFSFEMHKGPIQRGLNACHRCDTPACVNPEHLFPGTHADNVADKVVKGRQPKGARHAQAKIDDSIVLAIVNFVKAGRSHTEVAKQFGVSRPLVSMIASGKRWAHVTHI